MSTKKVLPITNFAKAGLNSDILPWDLPADYMTNIRNIRVTANHLSPFGGHATWAVLPVDHDSGFLMHVGSVSSDYWVTPGLNAIYAFDGGSFHDISSVGGYPGVHDSDYWDGCLLSTIPILNNPGHYPEYWPQPSVGVPMEPLPWDADRTWEDAGESCLIIRSHKQYLFALVLQSGSQELVDGVRWSAPADVGGVPPTWDPLDTTSVAGMVTLGSSGGRIVDGLTLRDAFVVYRESSISIFDYVGGQYVWRIRHLSATAGLVAQNAIIEVEGIHYFIGDGDILTNDGNSITSLLHNRLRKKFSIDFNPDSYRNSFVVKNSALSEAWFCIPGVGSEYANIAYVYNWRDNTWSIRDLPAVVFANYGPKNSAPVTWDSIQGDWDSNSSVWIQKQTSPFDDTVLAITKPEGAGQSGSILILEVSLGENEAPYSCNIERISYALEGLNSTTTIQTVFPHIRGSGSVFVQIGSQQYAGGAIHWKAPVEFFPEKDRKVDIRTTGTLHCFRFYAENITATFDFSGIDIEYVTAGER